MLLCDRGPVRVSGLAACGAVWQRVQRLPAAAVRCARAADRAGRTGRTQRAPGAAARRHSITGERPPLGHSHCIAEPL